ncbi:DUF3192 domain-containing protein [Shewanella sp. C32]|uniref:DUF3192 domain-containing protein n=1 Tax=Shewanella electrica TaxID=515560 RepID=A0ABT2FMM3_9GAMM|nr:DUF3192 domain-containing protein [Shewanella electrica]MCH1924677.1 DUF3192 domain-containing protein [Shewanella electrica]MCS4556875.1 DUF3192 domain-containing protein [Shewanella electrica]
MNKLLPILAIASLSLTGCVVSVGHGDSANDRESWEQVQRQNQQMIASLKLGMSIDQVQALMGTPSFNEAFESQGKTVQVLFYRTQHQHSDGKTTRDECTPLIFSEGTLTGWGDKPYSQL